MRIVFGQSSFFGYKSRASKIRGANILNIRGMQKSDKQAVLDMMRDFYSSPAVFTNGSDEIFINDIENCIGACPFLDGWIFDENGEILGYAMTAKSYSTEFGKPCVWIEDIYIKKEHRGKGIGTKFFAFAEKQYKNCLLRLEVEEENTAAVKLYEKSGFDVLPYMEMKKNLK